jgi:hypothetical protein
MSAQALILEALEARIQLANFAQRFLLGQDRCYCCRLPAGIVELKYTRLGPHKGCNPLCTLCWKHQSIDSRLRAYREMYHDQKDDRLKEVSWDLIEQMVRSGG